MKKCFVFGITLYFCSPVIAQKENWEKLDLKDDSVFGISSQKAYKELLGNKHAKTVIVGIIDSGIDTVQEDLKSVLWTNPSDGSHGWDYIGQETGREDIALLVGSKKAFYDSLSYTMVPESYRAGYQTYRKLSPQLDAKIGDIKKVISELKMAELIADSLVQKMGKENPVVEDFKGYQSQNDQEKEIVKRIIKRLPIYNNWQEYRRAEISHIIELAQFHLDHGLNIDNEERDSAIGDSDISPDKLGPVSEPNLTAYHGTHVAGTIGAVRDNGIGMDGIADHVQIMMLKVNGTLRELRDESLAKAIRFAVDHGAKVINLSFGKPYSWAKKDVDEAVKYAMQKDVLLIHAAGNSGQDLDAVEHYPNPVYGDKSGIAKAWIEVGASGPKNDATLAANFSNYGAKSVDVFAPGVEIYSTLPFNQYASWSGTSMAAPVVTGLAALIREYYPKLTALQVRDIICKSVVKSPFLDGKCVTGGIVNAYTSLKLAAALNK